MSRATGIVNLIDRRAEGGDSQRSRIGDSACHGDLAPSRKGSLARSGTEVGSDGSGIGDVEKVRDLIVN